MGTAMSEAFAGLHDWDPTEPGWCLAVTLLVVYLILGPAGLGGQSEYATSVCSSDQGLGLQYVIRNISL